MFSINPLKYITIPYSLSNILNHDHSMIHKKLLVEDLHKEYLFRLSIINKKTTTTTSTRRGSIYKNNLDLCEKYIVEYNTISGYSKEYTLECVMLLRKYFKEIIHHYHHSNTSKQNNSEHEENTTTTTTRSFNATAIDRNKMKIKLSLIMKDFNNYIINKEDEQHDSDGYDLEDVDLD